MREPVYEENYKGLKIKIYQDEDARSPDEDGDDGLFLVGYHSNFTVDRGQRALVPICTEETFKDGQRHYLDAKSKWYSYEEAKKEGLIDKEVRRGKYTPGISQSLAQCIARGGKYEDGSVNDEAKEYCQKYHIFGLEAYIHSGVVLALSHEGNFCDRQWDVSQLGLVFVSKKEWARRPLARKAALGLIETWNDALSGNVYGYEVEDAAGEHLDSCWGYYGDYEDGALSEARNIAEWHYKDLMKKKAARVKSLIKNRVPLMYQEA